MSNVIVLRTVYALNSNTGQFLSAGQTLVTNGLGGTYWLDANSTLILTGGTIMNNLPSSVNNIYINQSNINIISSVLYPGLSSLSVAITQTAGTISQNNLVSSMAGIGNSGYTSTATVSTIVGATAATGVTTPSTMSSIAGQISSYGIPTQSTLNLNLTSTSQGLGAFYVSTSQLVSTTLGLSQYISSIQASTTNLSFSVSASTGTALASTVRGLGTSSYLSTPSLVSTVNGLGQRYISTGVFTSTVAGLAQSGYVSSTQLMSTFIALSSIKPNIRFDTTTSVTTIDSINYFQTTGSIIYVSTFFQSTFYYSGNNQLMGGANAGTHDMFFSTASMNFSPFSSFINGQSRLTLDIYPTIAFSKLATGATAVPMLYISTFLQAGNTRIYNTTVTNWFFVGNTRTLLENGSYVDSSNIFSQAIKMTIPQNVINNAYLSTFSLIHYMPSSLNNGALQNALHNSTLTPFFASTNSLFLSVQNLV
jgi:hypothetical protein